MQLANGYGFRNASTSRRTTKLTAKRPGRTSYVESLEGRVLFSTNLLLNGDFSLGNVGFTNQYANGPLGTGSYVVGSNPKVDLDRGIRKYASFGDHTTGTGLMLEVDGSTKANKSAWEETVNVAPGTNYIFTGFDASMCDTNGNNIDSSPARLAVYINGVPTGDVFTAIAKAGKWSQFATVWNDTSSTTAVISIVDLNTSHPGNDFVLDGLEFAASPNEVVNGDFSHGNTGFSSQYVYQQSHQGGYSIVANPTDLESGFASIGDHTTGAGSMLVADGSGITNHSVWQENVDVTGGTKYVFSGWATSVGRTSRNPANLAIYVDGLQLGSTVKLTAKAGQWSKFSSIWTASGSGSVSITIVDLNVQSSGNNFALDDLALAQT